MRGDVFDGRGFLKSAMSSKEADSKSKTKNIDFDLDLKLGAVAGFDGEALRSVDLKIVGRNGTVKNFTLSGKLGRDTPLTADMRARTPGGREVIYLETNDAGAFFRFTDTYSKVVGGQLALAMDPPTTEPQRQRRPGQRPRFHHQGRGRARPGRRGRTERRCQNGVSFSRLRAEFSRQNGMWTIRDGVVKGPLVGGTIKGTIDYPGNR